MELADILPEESVLYCAAEITKNEVLRLLAETAAARTGQSAEAIYEAIHGRELLGSTGLGNGIAIPHGKLPGLRGVIAVFARLEKPVDFDSVDDQPVDLVMMLLAPHGAGADHLRALALVARVLRTDAVADQLRDLREPAHLHGLLTQPLATHQAA